MEEMAGAPHPHQPSLLERWPVSLSILAGITGPATHRPAPRAAGPPGDSAHRMAVPKVFGELSPKNMTIWKDLL